MKANRQKMLCQIADIKSGLVNVAKRLGLKKEADFNDAANF